MGIKRGDLVEFTDAYYRNDPPADARRFGVAIEDEPITGHDQRIFPVRVQLADGSTYQVEHVTAYAWTGWVPEGLDRVLADVRGVDPEFDDEYGGL